MRNCELTHETLVDFKDKVFKPLRKISANYYDYCCSYFPHHHYSNGSTFLVYMILTQTDAYLHDIHSMGFQNKCKMLLVAYLEDLDYGQKY